MGRTNVMAADAPHFTPPRFAVTREPGHNMKSAPMPEIEGGARLLAGRIEQGRGHDAVGAVRAE